jgi:hypothetical protein
MSEEGKEKVRESNRRRWADPVEREKQIDLRTGVVRKPESIQKGIESRKWYKPSEETKEKQRESNKKYIETHPERYEQVCQNLSSRHTFESGRELGLKNKGRKHSKESRLHMGILKIGNKNHFFGKTHSDITLCKMRENRKGKCTGEDNPLWKGGISFEPYCYKFNARRRRSVRNFFKNLCICCGCHTSENISKGSRSVLVPKELSVHHIHHNKNEGCNGLPFNLVPMCEECHLDERWNEEEYKIYINRTLSEGFKWGIWSEQEYIKKVMYPE